MDQEAQTIASGEEAPRPIAPARPESLPPERREASVLSELQRLRLLAAGLLPRQHDREDLVQDVWVQILEVPPERARSHGWLRVVSDHTARRLARRVRSREARERVVARSERLPSALEELERESLRAELRRWIEDLERPYREVLRLRFLEERPPREIAALLARSEGTVRSQLKRGLDQLRERHGERDPHEGGRSWLSGLMGLFAGRRDLGGSALPRIAATLAAMVGVGALIALLALLARELGGPSGARPLEVAARLASLEVEASERSVVVTTSRSASAEETLPAPPAEPEGSLVRGRAIDVLGDPIADAEVWTASAGAPEEARRTAQTAADGSFELALERGDWWVWGESLERGLTRRFLVSEPWEDRGSELTLQFNRSAFAGLRGVLLDSGGAPVVDARVHVQMLERAEQVVGDQGIQTRPIAGVPRRTDAEGRFALPRPLGGRQLLVVVPRAAAPSLHWIDNYRNEDLTIALPAPARLEGQVFLPDGAPAGGVQLHVEHPEPLPGAEARTGLDGRFCFDALPAGPFTLIGRVEGGAESLSIVVEGALAEGRTSALERLRLARDWTIRGAARGATGPLAGWSVSLEDERERSSPPPRRSTLTAADGGFAFAGCAGTSYTLRLHPPDSSGAHPATAHAVARGVAPGGAPLELVARADDAPSASVAGTLSLRELPRASATIVAARPVAHPAEEALATRVERGSGRFELGPLVPGRYELYAADPVLGSWKLASLDLAPRERIDLGAHFAPRTGSLMVRWSQPETARGAGMDFVVRGQGLCLASFPALPGGRIEVDAAARIARIHRLLPGEYALRVEGARVAFLEREVQVVEGQETAVEIDLSEGRVAVLDVTAARTLQPGETLALRVCSADGVLEVTPDAVGTRPEALLQHRLGLAAGEYRAEVSTSGGLFAEREFVIRHDVQRVLVPLHLE